MTTPADGTPQDESLVKKIATSKKVSVPRDTILFFSGLIGVVHETILASADRPQLLLLFAAMMGLPAFLRADESRKKQ